MKSIFPLILIVAVIGLFFFEVKPLYSEVSVLRAESAEYDHALDMAEELGTIRGELTKKLESFSKADLDRLNHFLPQQLDTVRIILDMDGIGIRNGIKLNDIKVANAGAVKTTETAKVQGAKAGGAGYQTVDVSFDFSAPYPQAIDFIKDVEQSLRLFDSSSVNISPSSKGGSIYNFKMNIHTYWINR